jgi:hypothetical protein
MRYRTTRHPRVLGDLLHRNCGTHSMARRSRLAAHLATGYRRCLNFFRSADAWRHSCVQRKLLAISSSRTIDYCAKLRISPLQECGLYGIRRPQAQPRADAHDPVVFDAARQVHGWHAPRTRCPHRQKWRIASTASMACVRLPPFCSNVAVRPPLLNVQVGLSALAAA